MTLAAHEDKTYRGGYIASPTMPWVWGTGLENPSGAYHLVWSRDLYQIATALKAAGDTAGANRARGLPLQRQQKPDGSFPQNSTVDGTPHWTNLQLDEVALPIVLAWQLGRSDGRSTRPHQEGRGLHRELPGRAVLSAGALGEPERILARHDRRGDRRPRVRGGHRAKNGDAASAARYEQTADDWQQRVEGWTATTNGPYSPKPYYLRLTKDGNPNAGTPYNIGDSGPTSTSARSSTRASSSSSGLGVKRATTRRSSTP